MVNIIIGKAIINFLFNNKININHDNVAICIKNKIIASFNDFLSMVMVNVCK